MFYNKNNDLDGDPYGIRTRVAAVKGRWICVLDYPNSWFTWVYYPVIPTHTPSKSVNKVLTFKICFYPLKNCIFIGLLFYIKKMKLFIKI